MDLREDVKEKIYPVFLEQLRNPEIEQSKSLALLLTSDSVASKRRDLHVQHKEKAKIPTIAALS